MTWYKDWFGEDYLQVYPHRNEAEASRQVDFVVKLMSLSKKHRILDLGCGNGRHSAELSKRGLNVVCLDLSAVLLSLARKADVCCTRFVRADMRHLPFTQSFDAVLSFFTTFGYFTTDEENLQTLRSIEQALSPGGWFLQDYMNKDFVLDNLVPRNELQVNGVRVIQERTYDKASKRIEKCITIKQNSESRQYLESVRLYTLDEMRELLAETDLVLSHTYGDFDGSPVTSESPRLILVGRKVGEY